MLVDLLRVTTADGLSLDGIFQHAAAPDSPLDAVVCVHGTGSSFYGTTLFDALAVSLLERGTAVLRINTRGHDLVSTAVTSRGGKRLGAAYETLDDCRHDLAAWVRWLVNRGYKRIGLVGHSSGAVKAVYAQAVSPMDGVTCVVAVSPPRLSHEWFLATEQAETFRSLFAEAERHVAEGRPQALMDVTFPLPFLVTAAGYVEKYGTDERYNVVRLMPRLGVRTLATFGDKELGNVAFRGAPEAIRATGAAVDIETIAGADHYYSGVREELSRRVMVWLAKGGG